MRKLLKQLKWETLLTAALYIVLGVVALVIPDTMVKTLGYLIGILLILAGAVSMICYLLREASQNYYRNDFGYGLVSIAVGILFLYKVEWIISLVPVILGILVVASGADKADAVRKTVQGPVTPEVPASILQLHPNVTIIGDEAALSGLK